MNLASKMRQGTIDRLAAALAQDPTIAVTLKEMSESDGCSEEHLLSLGLTKSDLLRLERTGFAVRGYIRGVNRLRIPGTGTMRKRWLIVDLNTEPEAPKEENAT